MLVANVNNFKGHYADNLSKIALRCSFFFLPVLICTTSIKLSGLKLNAFLLLYANDISKGKGQRSGTKPVMTEDFLAMENSELIYR